MKVVNNNLMYKDNIIAIIDIVRKTVNYAWGYFPEHAYSKKTQKWAKDNGYRVTTGF